LLDTPTGEIWGGSQSAYLVGQHVHQLGLRVRPTVGQEALEMVPDAFVGVPGRLIVGVTLTWRAAGERRPLYASYGLTQACSAR
jgi:hypothetical protein